MSGALELASGFSVPNDVQIVNIVVMPTHLFVTALFADNHQNFGKIPALSLNDLIAVLEKHGFSKHSLSNPPNHYCYWHEQRVLEHVATERH